MDEKFWGKTKKLMGKIMEEVDENGRISLEAYKRLFPGSYKRLLRLCKFSQKIMASKIQVIKQTREEVAKETERMNESTRKNPKELLTYLEKTGQIKKEFQKTSSGAKPATTKEERRERGIKGGKNLAAALGRKVETL